MGLSLAAAEDGRGDNDRGDRADESESLSDDRGVTDSIDDPVAMESMRRMLPTSSSASMMLMDKPEGKEGRLMGARVETEQ